MTYIVTLGLCCVLSAVIFFDLRQMRIPNALSLILIGLFIVLTFDLGFGDVGIRLLQGAVIFALGFLAFMFHLIGGGDVKILSALALFIPPEHIAVLMLLFSATLIVGISLVVLCRRLVPTQRSGWAFLNTAQLPMGLPIGAAGLIALLAASVS